MNDMHKPWEKNNKDPLFNEFYTLYENCEIIFRDIIDVLNNKHIHCPCDTEESNIVKWLKDNTTAIVTYSSFDCNSEEARKLMKEADMIVTNPPYSMRVWKPLFIWLNENNKPYFIFGPILQSGSIKVFAKYKPYLYTPKDHRANMYMYKRPSGELLPAATLFYTSYKLRHNSIKYKPKQNIEYFEGIQVYNRSAHVPPDYYDWMYVPCTYLCFIDLDDFEIDIEAKRIPGKYCRYKVRRKRPVYYYLSIIE